MHLFTYALSHLTSLLLFPLTYNIPSLLLFIFSENEGPLPSEGSTKSGDDFLFFTEEEREWLLADAKEKEKERESLGSVGGGGGGGGGGAEQRIKEAAKAKADLVTNTLLPR